MSDPDGSTMLGAISLYGGVAWAASKIIGTLVQTATDGTVRNRLDEGRATIAARLRGLATEHGLFGDMPTSSATNQDLQRALRAAWVRVAQQKLAEIRAMETALRRSPEFHADGDIALLAACLGEVLGELEVAATRRTDHLVAASPVEDRLLALVEAASEGSSAARDGSFIVELDEAFVDGVIALPIDWGPFRTRVEKILRQPSGPSGSSAAQSPGEAILERFVENLKSGLYPAASRAYEILVGGLIRSDIEALGEDLESRSANLAGAISELRQTIDDAFPPDARASFHRQFEEDLRKIASGTAAARDGIARLEALVGARDHDLKRTVDAVADRRAHLTARFFGRQVEIEAMFERFEQWPATLTIMTAPAGTGKSGFMARLADLAQRRGFAVATHFVSRDHDATTEPEDVLGHLALQLRAFQRKDDDAGPGGRLDDTAKRLANEIDLHLCASRPYARPLLVLIDGLDEMAGRLPVPIPRRKLGSNIHVVVSCRAGGPADTPPTLLEWISGDTTGRLRTIGGDATRQKLPPLDQASIALWLAGVLAKTDPVETLPIVRRLEAASEGLAVFLQYLIEDIVAAREAGQTLDSIERDLADLPAPFAAYLRRELSQKQADRHPLYDQSARRFLGLVAVSVGVLGNGELGALVGDLDPVDPPAPVRRWLARVDDPGNGGWAMQHPRLAEPFVAALGEEADDAREALEQYCRTICEERLPRRADYAAYWSVRHLAERDDPESWRIADDWLADPDFISWRLSIAPTRRMIRTIKEDYIALEQRRRLSTQCDELGRIFASVAVIMGREADE